MTTGKCRGEIHLDIALDVERKNGTIKDHQLAVESDVDDVTASRPSGLFREFLFDVSPINMEDWSEAGRVMRVFLLIRAVPMFFLQLLIPVVNQTSVKRGWSKLLNCIQLCITPLMATFVLQGITSVRLQFYISGLCKYLNHSPRIE